MDEARARLYVLLGDLLLEPRPETLAIARGVPWLGLSGDDEALAASHHAALDQETLPWVPVYLTPDGLLSDPRADLVGAWLVAAGRGAAGAPRTLARVLPPLVLALRDAGEPPWARAAELALGLVVEDAGAEVPWGLPGGLPSLGDPATDLAAIAAALVRPARSGWAPTRRALRRVAAAAGVPSGFGDRATMLRTALLSAVDAGRVGELLGALEEELTRWDGGLEALEVPVGVWRAAVGETRVWVGEVRRSVRS